MNTRDWGIKLPRVDSFDTFPVNVFRLNVTIYHKTKNYCCDHCGPTLPLGSLPVGIPPGRFGVFTRTENKYHITCTSPAVVKPRFGRSRKNHLRHSSGQFIHFVSNAAWLLENREHFFS